MKVEAAGTSETSITIYRTTHCRNPSQYELFTAAETSYLIPVVASQFAVHTPVSRACLFSGWEYRNRTKRWRGELCKVFRSYPVWFLAMSQASAFRGFLQSFQSNSETIPWHKPRSLPPTFLSTMFPYHLVVYIRNVRLKERRSIA